MANLRTFNGNRLPAAAHEPWATTVILGATISDLNGDLVAQVNYLGAI